MSLRKIFVARKKRIARRQERAVRFNASGTPVLSGTNIHYEMSDKTQAVSVGGIGVIHKLARESGLVDAIDRNLEILKMNFPYTESDHVLNIAYNALCGGRHLEDIELRRHDEAYLNALGAESVPDPTTAGDFCRRFDSVHKIERLCDAIDEARLEVWKRQPAAFFDQAIIDMDGHVLETTGSCKEGMDIAYNGKWGYHPLLISLANTQEVLGVMNRPGNATSEQDSRHHIERAIDLCLRAGFRQIVLRGDSKFSQTAYFDEWDKRGIRFQFGYPVQKNFIKIVENLPENAWQRLNRPVRYEVKTRRRGRRRNVKEGIVVQREYENQILEYEEVAEFEYRPNKCRKTYRMIVVRKNVRVEKGQQWLFNTDPFLLYIANDWESSASEIVFSCNRRCNQERTIDQLVNGVRAFRAPVDNLLSNWAYMVMTCLAWNLKAWAALWLPETGRWSKKHHREKQKVLNMNFHTFVNYFIRFPCQIVRSGRRIIYRILNWNPYLSVFHRLAIQLNC